MSTSATLDIKIIPNHGFGMVQVINEVKLFVEQVEHYSYYNIKNRNNEFGKFYISYDRIDHFHLDIFVTAIDGLLSFSTELTLISEEPSADITVISISTGSKIRDVSPDRSEPEDESIDLESLNE